MALSELSETRDELTNDVYVKPLRKMQLRQGSHTTFDVETVDGLKRVESIPFCWGFCYEEKGKRKVIQGSRITSGQSLKRMFKYLKRKTEKSKRPQVVYVHNLDFEAAFVEDYVVRVLKEPFRPIKSGSSIVGVNIKSHYTTFIDSAGILQNSQERAEIEWKVPTKYTKINCQRIFNTPYEFWSEEEKKKVIAHNKNDVIALHIIMGKFRRMVYKLDGIDCLRYITLSSMSIGAFRTNLWKNPEVRTHIMMNGGNIEYMKGIPNPFVYFQKTGDLSKNLTLRYKKKWESYARKAYFGGRNEIFILGVARWLAYADRNSMFPAEMEKQYYPLGYPVMTYDRKFLKRIITKHSIGETVKGVEFCDNPLGIIKCRVKVPLNEKYPLLALRTEQKVMFTNCERVWNYTVPELQVAQAEGYEIEPISGLIYPDKGKVFKQYVERHYAYRLEHYHEKGKSKMAKHFMNRLYGKWGQKHITRIFRFQVFEERDKAQAYLDEKQREFEASLSKTEKKYELEYRGDLVKNKEENTWVCRYLEKSQRSKPYMNVIMAVYTTAYARINLYRNLKKCERLGVEAYYCDTDSIVVPFGEETKVFTIGEELGEWKNENVFEIVEFLAPKCYFGYTQKKEWLIKAKGVDRRAIRTIEEKYNDPDHKHDLEKDFAEISKILHRQIKADEKYASYSVAHNHGLIFDTVVPSNMYRFENLKRNFSDKKGGSIPWNDSTIPDKFKNEKGVVKGEVAI